MQVIAWYAARLGYIGFGAAGALATIAALDALPMVAAMFAAMAGAFFSLAMVFDRSV